MARRNSKSGSELPPHRNPHGLSASPERIGKLKQGALSAQSVFPGVRNEPCKCGAGQF